MGNPVTSLREAENRVYATGYLEECNLKEDISKDGKEFIGGNIVVGITPEEKYSFNFYANKYTANNEISKKYLGFQTIISQYISRAKQLRENLPEESISKISISGSFGVSDYYNEEKQTMYTNTRLVGNFVNRVEPKEGEEFEPSTNFSLELYFESIEKETEEVDGQQRETGRVKIEGIVPIYNGQVIPITLYTATDNPYIDVSKYIYEHYSAGHSSKIQGRLKCKIETTTYTVNGGFGAPSTEKTYTNFRFEPIIYSGEEEQYLITDPKHFDKNTIKSAMAYRNEQLENKKNKNNTANTVSKGFGGGFAKDFGSPIPEDSENPFGTSNEFNAEDIKF